MQEAAAAVAAMQEAVAAMVEEAEVDAVALQAKWAPNEEHATRMFIGVEDIVDEDGYRMFFTLVMQKIMASKMIAGRHDSSPETPNPNPSPGTFS
jgi:hypothetical protein